MGSLIESIHIPIDLTERGPTILALETLMADANLSRFAGFGSFDRALNDLVTMEREVSMQEFLQYYAENSIRNPEPTYLTPYRWYNAVGDAVGNFASQVGKLAAQIINSAFDIMGSVVSTASFLLNPKNFLYTLAIGVGLFMVVKFLLFGNANANLGDQVANIAGKAVGEAGKTFLPGVSEASKALAPAVASIGNELFSNEQASAGLGEISKLIGGRHDSIL